MNSWNRIETWLMAIAVGIGLLATAIFGLDTYMKGTPPLHKEATKVPSVMESTPAPRWESAVERARQAARAGLVERSLPGVSVAVGVSGEIVWAEGFGFADLEKRTPVAPDLRFRIGTASKALTSAAVGLLLEKGRLKLDDEIQTYVPQFPKKRWPITLRQLMGHLSGVGNDGGDEGPLFSMHCRRPVDALEAFAEDDLRFEPGTRYRDSSYGWILVSAAIEAASGAPFVDFMAKDVFGPLGMNATRADSATEPIPDRVMPYFPRYGGDPRWGFHAMRDLDYSCYAGASVFLSTPSDLVRFGLAMNSGRFLKPATVELLQASQLLPSGEETGYGLGWDLEKVTFLGRETRVVGHDGDVLGGMAASLMILRERGIVVAVTANISYTDTASIALKVAEAFAEPRGSDSGR